MVLNCLLKLLCRRLLKECCEHGELTRFLAWSLHVHRVAVYPYALVQYSLTLGSLNEDPVFLIHNTCVD